MPAVAVADPAPASRTTAESEPAAPPPVTAEAAVAVASPTVETSSALELPLDEVFFKSSELDEQPYPLLSVEPTFPYTARVNRLEGWVRLLLLIDKAGELQRIEVLDASLPGVFDDAAVAAFQVTPFAPGRRAGEAVNSRMVLKVEFKQEPLLPERPE